MRPATIAWLALAALLFLGGVRSRTVDAFFADLLFLASLCTFFYVIFIRSSSRRGESPKRPSEEEPPSA
ncbi:hypothetical protein BH18ACT15_BH18ACT15_05750 [soil metagenome]